MVIACFPSALFFFFCKDFCFSSPEKNDIFGAFTLLGFFFPCGIPSKKDVDSGLFIREKGDIRDTGFWQYNPQPPLKLTFPVLSEDLPDALGVTGMVSMGDLKSLSVDSKVNHLQT